MAEVLNKAPTPTATTDTALIIIKLDGSHYALWSQVVEMFISERDKLGYINGDLPQPASTDPLFRIWRIENTIVKGWLINTMDSSIVSTFIRYPTTKKVWDAITVTFFDESDTAQVYELQRQMKMVYVFLDDFDDQLDQVRSTQAYACVRREMVRQTMMGNGSDEGMRVGLASKGLKTGPNPFGKDEVLVLNKSNPTGITSLRSTRSSKCNLWILDSRATDHMTFDAQDFCQHIALKRTNIMNANDTISSEYFHQHGLIYQNSCPHTLKQNVRIAIFSRPHYISTSDYNASSLNLWICCLHSSSPQLAHQTRPLCSSLSLSRLCHKSERLQGKTHDEELNWFKDIPDIPDIPLTIEPPRPTTETSILIVERPPHSTIPHDPTSENIPEEILENAFLHGGLDEEIYMDVPFGYIEMFGKMSPRAWFGCLSLAMRKYGFQQSNCDHTLFLKLYVDDMIITGNDTKEVAKLQIQLAAKFEMKSLEVRLLDCKPIDVLIQQNHRLGEYLNQIPNDKGNPKEGNYVMKEWTPVNYGFAGDAITQGSWLSDDGSTLVFPAKIFELGFFTPKESSNNGSYVGIWYHGLNDKTVIWVANQDKPIYDTNGIFGIEADGKLKVLDETGQVYCHSDVETSSSVDRVVKLMDSGNLVLSDSKSGETIWESLHNPTNTFLPGMKMVGNLKLVSRRSAVDFAWKLHLQVR
ncbi:hypothetical protein AAG906_040370 [Vitis piasezkii]